MRFRYVHQALALLLTALVLSVLSGFGQFVWADPPASAWEKYHASGETALRANNLADAEAGFLQALIEAKTQYEKKVPGSAELMARSYNDLGIIWRAQGKYAEAEIAFKNSLKIYDEALNSQNTASQTHPYFKIVLMNLAGLYQEKGDYPAVESLYKRYLAVKEEQLGAQHLDLAMTLHALAQRYNQQGRYEEAARLYKQALPVFEQAYGPEHGLVVSTKKMIALLQPSSSQPAPQQTAEIKPRIRKEQIAATQQELDDHVFDAFLSGLEGKIRRYWDPPEYYRHVDVTVLITLDKQGELFDYHLKESSGFNPADEAALKAVKYAAPFSPFPKEYKQDHLVIEFNFN